MHYEILCIMTLCIMRISTVLARNRALPSNAKQLAVAVPAHQMTTMTINQTLMIKPHVQYSPISVRRVTYGTHPKTARLTIKYFPRNQASD